MLHRTRNACKSLADIGRKEWKLSMLKPNWSYRVESQRYMITIDYSVCNFCCNQTEKLLHILTLTRAKELAELRINDSVLSKFHYGIAKWIRDSLCNFLFGFSMLCDSAIVYKFRIHYIVNIIHLFSSLFDQFYNIYWTHDFVLYLLWTVITIAWFQELYGVDESDHSYVVLFSRKTSCALICVSMYSNIYNVYRHKFILLYDIHMHL